MKCEASVQNPEDGTLQYLWVSLYRTGTARPVGTCNGLNGGWMQIFFLATLVLLHGAIYVCSCWRYKRSAPMEPYNADSYKRSFFMATQGDPHCMLGEKARGYSSGVASLCSSTIIFSV